MLAPPQDTAEASSEAHTHTFTQKRSGRVAAGECRVAGSSGAPACTAILLWLALSLTAKSSF